MTDFLSSEDRFDDQRPHRLRRDDTKADTDTVKSGGDLPNQFLAMGDGDSRPAVLAQSRRKQDRFARAGRADRHDVLNPRLPRAVDAFQ